MSITKCPFFQCPVVQKEIETHMRPKLCPAYYEIDVSVEEGKYHLTGILPKNVRAENIHVKLALGSIYIKFWFQNEAETEHITVEKEIKAAIWDLSVEPIIMLCNGRLEVWIDIENK